MKIAYFIVVKTVMTVTRPIFFVLLMASCQASNFVIDDDVIDVIKDALKANSVAGDAKDDAVADAKEDVNVDVNRDIANERIEVSTYYLKPNRTKGPSLFCPKSLV